jgi:hypothetical protein
MIAGNTADTLDIFFAWAVDNFEEVNVVCQPENFDDTLEVCKMWEEGNERIRLQIHEFDNFSAQFQRAIDMCTKDWVFQLGSDEILAEFPYGQIPKLMDRMKKDVGVLPRFNLQRDYKHYNADGWPDWQQRLIRMNCGVGMDGAVVDEHLNAAPSQMAILEALPMIHFGHIRPPAALRQKGTDRLRFAEDDACDGPKLKEFGEQWFIKRNEEWDKAATPMMSQHIRWIEKYLPVNSPLRRMT